MSFLPNELNKLFDTYTYSLALYMVHPTTINQTNTNLRKPASHRLIASNEYDSAYNISRLETTFVVGSSKVGDGINSRVDFTIEEPNGVTLLPKIVDSARELGIQNHVTAGYLLEIKFLGRKDDGSPVKFNENFYIPLFFTTFQMITRSEGARYNITSVEQNILGFHHQYGTLQRSIVIEAKTFGDFLISFEEAINNYNQNEVEVDPNVLYPTIYEFMIADNIRDQWSKWKIEQAENVKKGSYRIQSVGDNLQLTFSKGSRFDKIIETVLRHTVEYKKIPIATNAKTIKSDGSSHTTENNIDVAPAFFKLFPEIENLKYDYISGRYQKKIKYLVYKYAIPDHPIDVNRRNLGYTHQASQEKRAKYLIDNDFIKKKYDYLYTGKNTEVINLELTLDTLYYHATPIAGGLTGSPAMHMPISSGDREATISRGQQIVQLKSQLAGINRKLRESSLSPSNYQLLNESRQRVDSDLRRTIEQESRVGVSDDIVYTLAAYSDPLDSSTANSSDQDANAAGSQMGSIIFNKDTNADMLVIEMQIRGDPFWLGLPKTIESINKKRRSERGLSNLAKDGTMFWLNVKLPISDIDNEGRRVPKSNYQLSGLYRVIDVISVFENGQFMQYLKAVYDLTSNIPMMYNRLIRPSNNIQRSTELVPPLLEANTGSAAQDQEDSRVG